jgi:hypothetical protein
MVIIEIYLEFFNRKLQILCILYSNNLTDLGLCMLYVPTHVYCLLRHNQKVFRVTQWLINKIVPSVQGVVSRLEIKIHQKIFKVIYSKMTTTR